MINLKLALAGGGVRSVKSTGVLKRLMTIHLMH